MLVWLFVVLILSSSYTANLSSMLTVQRLQPVRDIEWLKRSNAPIGCDGDSFVMTYLQEVLNFNLKNIVKVKNESDYEEHFRNESIAAAFFELPYEKVFINKYCQGFTASTQTYRFGGFGFVSNNYSFYMLSFLHTHTHTHTHTQKTLLIAFQFPHNFKLIIPNKAQY